MKQRRQRYCLGGMAVGFGGATASERPKREDSVGRWMGERGRFATVDAWGGWVDLLIWLIVVFTVW